MQSNARSSALSELSRLPGGRATTELYSRPNLRSPVEPSLMKRQMNETERRNLMRNMRFCWNYIWRRHVVIPCVRSLLVVWSTLLDFGGSKFRVFVRLWIHDPGRGYCWGNIVRLSENQATHDFGVSKPYFFWPAGVAPAFDNQQLFFEVLTAKNEFLVVEKRKSRSA